jgi:hypothetical protein
VYYVLRRIKEAVKGWHDDQRRAEIARTKAESAKE